MKELPENPDRILIRSTNWIGDAIMTTPAVRTIRQNFPRSEISMLALPWMADVFSACPHIDHIFTYDKNAAHKGLAGKLKLAFDIRREHFDMTILLQNAFEAALITTIAGIPVRAGYTTDGRRLLLTHGVKKHPDIGTKHQVHYYQEMVQELGMIPGPDSLELFLDSKAVTSATQRLVEAETKDKQPIIGLNPGAAYGPAKCWPARKYGQLAKYLIEKTGALVLVFGTEADKKAAAEISVAAGGNVLDLTGDTTLAEALALIDRCHVFVTNDSGLMHVAAALGTPLVAIFGSTDHIATGPYSEQAIVIRKPLACSPCMKTHCPEKHFKCMENISMNEVAEASLSFLGKQ